MAIIDIFSFNGEYDLLKLRYEMLKDIVDEFIICEAMTTFGGQPKPMYSLATDIFYDSIPTWDKVKVWQIDDNYTPEEIEYARNSKYTNGEERWMHEFLQKESIKKAMTHLKDDDLVFIGDVDEIWEPHIVDLLTNYGNPYDGLIRKLKLRVYTYYLNFCSNEEFWGTVVGRYKDFKNDYLNNIRNNIRYRTTDFFGWHFTNMGGIEEVRRKVLANYNYIMFNDEYINSPKLDERFGVMDYIGRNFKLEVNELDWPPWLTEHRQEFIKMLK